MDFSRQKYWSALPFPPPGIELASPAMQANSFPAEPSGKPWSLWSWGQILSLPPFSSNPAETPPPGQTPDPRGRHDPRPCDCGITADLCTHCAFHLEPPLPLPGISSPSFGYQLTTPHIFPALSPSAANSSGLPRSSLGHSSAVANAVLVRAAEDLQGDNSDGPSWPRLAALLGGCSSLTPKSSRVLGPHHPSWLALLPVPTLETLGVSGLFSVRTEHSRGPSAST